MTGYNKLFGSILASSVWGEPDHVRVVWVTMLAMANKDGIVEASLPGLAHLARVSLENTADAIQRFTAPDAYSRTKDFDGRRIEAVDGGWRILNHRKYREKLNADERRAYLAEKQREHRAKLPPVNTCQHLSTLVNNRNGSSTPSTQAEAEAEAEAEASFGVNSTMLRKGGMGGVEVAPNGAVAPVPQKSPPQKLVVMNPPTREEIDLHAAKIGLPNHEVEKFAAYYTSNGWRVGKNPMKNWQAAMVGWKTRWEQDGAKGMKAVQRELTDADHAKGF